MAFGQASGPPAGARQVERIEELLARAGFDSVREARHPYGLTQRQAGGKFTIAEADLLIERLEAAELVQQGDADARDGRTGDGSIGAAGAARGPAGGHRCGAAGRTQQRRRVRSEWPRCCPRSTMTCSSPSSNDAAGAASRRCRSRSSPARRCGRRGAARLGGGRFSRAARRAGRSYGCPRGPRDRARRHRRGRATIRAHRRSVSPARRSWHPGSARRPCP